MRRACIPVTRTPPRSATSASRTPSFECGGGRTPSRTSTAPSGSRAPLWCCSRPTTTAGTRPGCAGTSRGRTTSSQAARSCAGTARRLLAADGPLTGPGAVVEHRRAAVLLLLGGGRGVARAAHRGPDAGGHLVLAAVEAAAADRARIAVRLAVGDRLHLGRDAHLGQSGAALLLDLALGHPLGGLGLAAGLLAEGRLFHGRWLDQRVLEARRGLGSGCRERRWYGHEKQRDGNQNHSAHVGVPPSVCRVQSARRAGPHAIARCGAQAGGGTRSATTRRLGRERYPERLFQV